MFRDIPGLCPLDASGSPLLVTSKYVLRHGRMSLGGGEGEIVPD